MYGKSVPNLLLMYFLHNLLLMYFYVLFVDRGTEHITSTSYYHP